jgi:hypothetical protein
MTISHPSGPDVIETERESLPVFETADECDDPLLLVEDETDVEAEDAPFEVCRAALEAPAPDGRSTHRTVTLPSA